MARSRIAIVLAALLGAAACVDAPVETERSEQPLLRGLLGAILGADGAGALKWNRIAWNRIAWNRIAWNRIAWNELSPAKRDWHELRVEVLPLASLSSAASDIRLRRALTDADVRDVFGPIVECALPASDSLTFTDLTGATWRWSGLHGLAPQWARSGPCNAGCQRSVTACLLARINYYGERNVLSWRRGAGLPYNSSTAAMESPPSDERASFDLDEGAVFGNLFLADPEISVCSGVDGILEVSLLGLIDVGIYGDDVPVSVLRMCAGDAECLDGVYAGTCASACARKRSNGAYDGCSAGPGAPIYDEVITIRRADFAVHADFVEGHPIDPALSSCAAEVGDELAECEEWFGSDCVNAGLAGCALHDVRTPGLALGRHASTCTGYVCAVDGYCCTLLWDARCAAEAADLCR